MPCRSFSSVLRRNNGTDDKLDIADQVNKIGTFTVNFTCHPYRYSYAGQTKTTYTASNFILTNPYPFNAKPYLKLNGRGDGKLTIQTPTSTNVWEFTTLNGYTECDSELMNFYHDATPKNDTVSGEGFPLLYPGENAIIFDGGISSIEVMPRWVMV